MLLTVKMTFADFIPRPVIDKPPITRPAAAQAPATGRIWSVVAPSPSTNCHSDSRVSFSIIAARMVTRTPTPAVKVGEYPKIRATMMPMIGSRKTHPVLNVSFAEGISSAEGRRLCLTDRK